MLFNLTLSKEQYPEADVIFARGPPGDGTTGRIPQHSNYYKATLDWAEGGAPAEGKDGSLTQVRRRRLFEIGLPNSSVWAIVLPAYLIRPPGMRQRAGDTCVLKSFPLTFCSCLIKLRYPVHMISDPPLNVRASSSRTLNRCTASFPNFQLHGLFFGQKQI